MQKIGALVIGQSPRPDLVSPLARSLPNHCEIVQAGALDGLKATDLPSIHKGAYPLTTRMRDGSQVMAEEAFLASRLQQTLNHLEEQDVVASILLCAGTFAELGGKRPLIKPFFVGRNVLNTFGMKKIGLISPIKEQESPIRQRWHAAGFEATVWTADLSQQDDMFHQMLNEHVAAHDLECIVLDYVGHPSQAVRQLQETAVLPILDLGQLAIATLSGVV